MVNVSRLTIVLTVLAYFLSLAALPYLPDQVAIHWNAAGEADGFSNKWVGAFLPPLLMTGLLIFMSALPKFDPKKANYSRFQKSYRIVNAALSCFFLALHAVTLAYNLGFSIDVGAVMPLGIGGLFLVIGNYMPKIKHNYFIGIRTPWTLASETVWHKTHRLGGKVFTAMGILSMLTAFWRGEMRAVLFLVIIVVGNLYLIVRSFLYEQQEQRNRS
ncbi:membrane protein [Geobacillus thermopakistaniensis]|uniref:Membrane protein n=1 Tax=Geobacillus thermopakistaniensis (strain MAS1) TaxID=1408282 RepID=A0A7U9J976_GEOTM|nr:SdpI family protein [Geobacillus sp. MAS1]ESU71269.1 membrane protein [Geobacillus sp. MAS1]